MHTIRILSIDFFFVENNSQFGFSKFFQRNGKKRMNRSKITGSKFQTCKMRRKENNTRKKSHEMRKI